MNYRHAFHAGNFADLVKHAALLQLLARLTADARPLMVIDTHAGRGLYDLAGPEASRSGEAAAGIMRLMQAPDRPAEFAPLVEAVRALNQGGAVRRYPGSSWLIAQALRRQDRCLACELRTDEHAALRATLKAQPNVETLGADGYETAQARCPSEGRVLILIDPPFERADDYARIVRTAARVRRKNPGALLLAWLPLKDLETFDAFLRDLEDQVRASVLVAETRMRPLSDPMRMNGCALVLIGAGNESAGALQAICGWTVESLGEQGSARIYGL